MLAKTTLVFLSKPEAIGDGRQNRCPLHQKSIVARG